MSFDKTETQPWDTEGEGIILGDNPAGHCFVLRDLITTTFFKEVMILKLKMLAASINVW